MFSFQKISTGPHKKVLKAFTIGVLLKSYKILYIVVRSQCALKSFHIRQTVIMMLDV